MRAALERIAEADGTSEGVIAAEALAEVDSLPASDAEAECEDCVGWQREYAMVLSSRDHWRRLTEERQARLARIREAVSEWDRTGNLYAARKRISDLSSPGSA